MGRSYRLAAALALLAGCAAACGAGKDARATWPAWEAFNQRFIQADGRVIDLTFDGKSTSEGQSYGLFFALVANQRERFDTILAWTSSNMAWNQLGERLPAWHWGKKDDDTWGIKDQNSASDSDLWIAYTLLEAARLWKEPRYAEQARKLLAQVRKQEVSEVSGVGPLLLPGPQGFQLSPDKVRLVTSYYPPFMFQYLEFADPGGGWKEMWEAFEPLALKASAAGVAPNVFLVESGGKVLPDSEATPEASYDAIRVYMWAAMSGKSGEKLVKALKPYAQIVKKVGGPPEKVDPANGKVLKQDYQPLGYSGALLPYLKAIGDEEELQRQQKRVEKAQTEYKLGIGNPPNYYDSALVLFGQGWVEGRYRFDETGRLVTPWAGPK